MPTRYESRTEVLNPNIPILRLHSIGSGLRSTHPPDPRVQQARRDNIPDQLENKVVHAIVCRGSKLDFESLIDDLRYSSPLEIIYLKSSVGKLFISDRDPHRASSLAYAEGMGCTPIAKKGKG